MIHSLPGDVGVAGKKGGVAEEGECNGDVVGGGFGGVRLGGGGGGPGGNSNDSWNSNGSNVSNVSNVSNESEDNVSHSRTSAAEVSGTAASLSLSFSSVAGYIFILRKHTAICFIAHMIHT